MMLQTEEVDKEIITQSKIVHFGSISLSDEPARTATFESIKQAKEMGKIISFDPNYRSQLWKSEDHAKEMMKKGLLNSDIVKLLEEEYHLFMGAMEFREGTEYLTKEYQIPLLFITLGNEGCLFRHGKDFVKMNAFNVKAVDTTGAGDAFLGGMLHKFIEYKVHPSLLKGCEVVEMATFANNVASLSVTKNGDIPSMPSLDEVDDLLYLEGSK